MTELVDRVRVRLASAAGGGHDPSASHELDAAVRSESGGVVDDAVFADLRREVAAELTGAGPLEELLARPGVSDVLVNAPSEVWVDCGGGLERAAVRFADEAAVRRLAQRLAAGAGRRLDDACPFVDAALADGTRLHVVLPPLVANTAISLRVLGRRRLALADLVASGGMHPEVAELLAAAVGARLAVLVSGSTGAGKTTLLGAMLGLVPAHERVIVVEDAAELALPAHGLRLTTRPANIEGAGAVGLRELVRQSLRMRPDRLVVGEFRGAEMVELLVALNTGHEGGAATLHANSAADVPARLFALGALAGLGAPAVSSLAAAFDVVVHLRRLRDGARVVAEVGLLDHIDGALAVTRVWSRDAGRGPAADRLADVLARRETAIPALLGRRAEWGSALPSLVGRAGSRG